MRARQPVSIRLNLRAIQQSAGFMHACMRASVPDPKKIQQSVSGSVSNWLIEFQHACMPVNESFDTDYLIAF